MTESLNRRLDSWKEIADYFGREVRTVIRWEKDRGLPVHRVPGAKRSAVFALVQELEAWQKSQTPAPDDSISPQALPAESGAMSPDVALSAPTSRPSIWHSKSLKYGLAAMSLVLVVAILWKIQAARVSSASGPLPLATPLVFQRIDFPARGPRCVRAADFNGDGKLDLVFTNSTENNVVVLLGDGRGGFSKRIVTASLAVPDQLVIADFNHDGKLDIALTSYAGGGVEVLLGEGDGTFHRSFLQDLGGRGRALIAGDFDRDGIPDLVVSGSGAKKMFVFRGKGDGTFQLSQSWPTDEEPAALVAADFNGDGILDLAVDDYMVSVGKTVSVYFGNGDATFQSRKQFASYIGPLGLTVADLNRDGRVDLITANFPDHLSILFSTGPGTFAPPVVLDAGRGHAFVAAADLNRDGTLDLLALGEHSDTMSILLGNGDGTFQPKHDVPTGGYPESAVIADFDGDGKPDVAVAAAVGDVVSVYLNKSEEKSSSFVRWFAAIKPLFPFGSS